MHTFKVAQIPSSRVVYKVKFLALHNKAVYGTSLGSLQKFEGAVGEVKGVLGS